MSRTLSFLIKRQRGILVHKLEGGEEGFGKNTGRLELIPLIKNALVWRCQGHAAVFKASLAPRGPPLAGPPGGSILGWMSGSAACRRLSSH